MPEMTFHVRWPDGSEERCYSPSLVVHEFLGTGTAYSIEDFVSRSSEALRIASDRVRERFGFACTSALQQESDILRTAQRFEGGTVRVLAMEPPAPAGQRVRP
ncbi:MSMEG_0570 family nitrogen starvation response protein [Rathayibacter sp. AY1B1]|uniref:MSMEG_0570 family nitrogen starvation response protein n=1 Tax=unclassified Rathayibacter TaxID=2609250 RepID=UPI000CE83ABB|nr:MULTISPECIES: MSMEG_0570 family nitrogen starvation response protein [unclassified Rathayibacter]PPI25256.1 MSMEG_0570 family nitrogen starvation response protein [Rathayibacter sp. AY1B6]PPI34835.1 MSMEG_0570 family nitrogen starvation response protein [Rathayibacter sp. AY1B1]